MSNVQFASWYVLYNPCLNHWACRSFKTPTAVCFCSRELCAHVISKFLFDCLMHWLICLVLHLQRFAFVMLTAHSTSVWSTDVSHSLVKCIEYLVTINWMPLPIVPLCLLEKIKKAFCRCYEVETLTCYQLGRRCWLFLPPQVRKAILLTLSRRILFNVKTSWC